MRFQVCVSHSAASGLCGRACGGVCGEAWGVLLLLLRCPVCDGPCSAGRFLPKSILTRTPSYTPYPGSGCLLPLDRRVRGNRRPSQRRLQVRHREASLPRRVQVLQRDVPCTTAGGTRVGTLSTLNHQPQTLNPKPELHGGWHQVHGHRMREPTALVRPPTLN